MLSSLTPKTLWQIFQQICAIPHPSHHEEMITKFIVDFANKHQIECHLDKVGNILLRKPASKGMENVTSIALQAHMDMVPQKNEDTIHDFLIDPIKPYIDGEWVKAQGTTLGADNGIGLASALAVLIEPDLAHGPLEVLITASEETGMVGAFGLQPNWLQSQFLINTDSEDDGEIFVGCAGGVDFKSSFNLSYVHVPANHDSAVRLALAGLKGGHSGCDIHLGRGNAIKLLVRFFAEFADQIDYRLAHIYGGSLRNAIPREAFAEITLPRKDMAKLMELIGQFEAILHNELKQTEPSLRFSAQELTIDKVKRVISKENQHKIIHWLNSAPNGVIRMSNEMEGTVETSLNLGILELKDNHIAAYFLIRSQVDSAKDNVVMMLSSHSELAQVNYEINGGYSGWEPDLNSQLLSLAQRNHQDIFAEPAHIKVIHAGLECGLFKKAYPNMDMISIGPSIVSPHSPDERVNIQTVSRYWDLLLTILRSANQLKLNK